MYDSVDTVGQAITLSNTSFLCTASKIRYEITRGNHGGAFAVKNETGAIYVAGPLDYETRKEVCIACYSPRPFLPSFFLFPWFALQFASCCSCLLSVARVSGSLSKRMSPSFLFLPPAVVCICLIHTTVPITPGRVG